MKFSIQREAILKPLTQVAGVVERRQTLPVLANLLVVAGEDNVSFTGTDLEVELVANLATDIDTPGEVTLPARKLVEICRALPDGTEVKLDVSGDRAKIQAGRSRFTLATLPASEFPVIDEVKTTQKVPIAQADLKRIIDKTAFAMAHQDVRYYLNGLLLELRDGLIRAVATDGHRLAICDLDADITVGDVVQMIVPRKGVLELVRLLDEEGDPVEVEMGRNHVRVSLPDGTFTSKLIDGRFPDYESVVPVGADQVVTMERSTFRDSLQRVSILSNEKYRGVKLELEPGTVRIIAHNPEQEEAVEELEVEVSEIERLAVGFNVTYLLDALNALDADTVQICLRDANSSCLLRLPESERSRHVVMPLRL